MAKRQSKLIPSIEIERSIHVTRGEKAMLDSDLAKLYRVSTKRLNEQFRRNVNRFPRDFAFRLTPQEFTRLKSQFATSSSEWGGRRYPPVAFTEHGALMLASVLNSPIAIEASIQVVRAFVRLRELLASHKDLARRLDELEAKFDEQFAVVFDAIRQLMSPPVEEKRELGYHTLRQ